MSLSRASLRLPRCLLVLALLGAGCAAAAESAPPAQRFDCLAGSLGCPEVTIEGDPWQELPGFGPSPFRGYGDPSVRRAPQGDRLWMTYSYLTIETAPGDPETRDTGVSIHLASSDDGGDTWRFRRRLSPAEPETDPAAPGGGGLSIHEVSTLAPLVSGSSVRWFGLHFRYFDPWGPERRRPGSMHFRLARGARPQKLAKTRRARLGGALTDPAWDLDLDLSRLDPELADCHIWTEPSLFGQDGRLYLVAQCLVLRGASGDRFRNREFIGVFASDGEGPIERLDWRWLGKLTTRSDARALKGHVLTQAEVTTSRDGSLLLLVTPKRLAPVERHLGCRVLELESLDPPRLARDENGKPIVRADLRSSDSTGLGPGLCSYDPASSTGVLFVRTEVAEDRFDVVFRLHATGIHP